MPRGEVRAEGERQDPHRSEHLYTRLSYSHLFPIPHPRRLRMSNLLLQLKDTIQQRLRRRRTPRHINIHRNNPINTPHHTITIMIVPATIRATSHANHPSGLWHLIVALQNSRSHFIGDCACNDHDIRLARGCAKDDAESVLVVAGHGAMHHF